VRRARVAAAASDPGAAAGARAGRMGEPARDPARQVDFLLDDDFNGEFFLTQVVSHHDRAAVERLVAEARRRGVKQPGMFGVFFYRSANPRTLAALRQFLPVPAEGWRRSSRRGNADRHLRPHHPGDPRRRRPPRLPQQPAAHSHEGDAGRDSGADLGCGLCGHPNCAVEADLQVRRHRRGCPRRGLAPAPSA